MHHDPAMGMEVKSFTPHDLDLKEDGSVVVAFAQTDAVDTDDDYTFPGFIKAGAVVPISQYGHSIWPQKGGTPPAGRGELKEDGGWAILKGGFFLKTAHGRDTYETVKGMAELQQWSYGYNVTEAASPPDGVKARRGIKKADVHEVSPVHLGAQPTTHTAGIKSFGSDVQDAQYAIGTIVRLIESESKRGSDTDVTNLRSAMNSLRTYTVDTFGQVGSDEDLAEIAAERDRIFKEWGQDPTFVATFKEGALAGLPFAEASARVLGYVEDLVTRATAIAEIRVKEGRAISTGRLQLLTQHHAALLAGADALKKLIDGATPTPKPEADSAAAKELMRDSMLARLGEARNTAASLKPN